MFKCLKLSLPSSNSPIGRIDPEDVQILPSRRKNKGKRKFNCFRKSYYGIKASRIMSLDGSHARTTWHEKCPQENADGRAFSPATSVPPEGHD